MFILVLSTNSTTKRSTNSTNSSTNTSTNSSNGRGCSLGAKRLDGTDLQTFRRSDSVTSSEWLRAPQM